MKKSKLKKLAAFFLIIVIGFYMVALILEYSKPNIDEMRYKGDVQGLIEALHHWDIYIRWKAAEALGEIGDARAVEPLIRALKDKDNVVRWKAAEALGKIGKPAVEPLIQALKDEDSDVRERAAEALGKIKDARAVEPLIRALEDKNWYVRRTAAEALGKIKDARAVEPLIQALKDKDSDVREKAAEALGEIGDARAVEPLIRALKDKDWDVRDKAAEALGEIGDARAVEPLIQALKDKDLSGWKVIIALGKIEDARAVEPLIRAQMEDAYKKSVRRVLMLTCDKMGRVYDMPYDEAGPVKDNERINEVYKVYYKVYVYDKAGRTLRFVPELSRYYEEPPSGEGIHLTEVTDGLGTVIGKVVWTDGHQIQDPRNHNRPIMIPVKEKEKEWDPTVFPGGTADSVVKVSTLIQALDKDADDHRVGAAIVLGKIGDERAVEPLIQVMKEDEGIIRMVAAEALGEIGDERAVEPLIQVMKEDGSWLVREVAKDALDKIKAKKS